MDAPSATVSGCTQNSAETLEIYKLLVEMADRMSQRRQTTNSFYLSIHSLLVGGSAYLGALPVDPWHIVMISIAGIAIGALWIRSIGSYRSLNSAKFGVINDLEKKLSVQPFTDEWARLKNAVGRQRHRPFHSVEIIVPWTFIAVYTVQMAASLPWRSILAVMSR